jgi:hypothetical protein
MKRYCLGILFLLAACSSEELPVSDECIDESKIREGVCTMEYNPVCGCNHVTYGNACQAGLAGVTSFTTGACK